MRLWRTTIWRRLLLLLVVVMLCGPPLVQAFLPVNIEHVITTWFNAAGQLIRLTFFPSVPVISLPNQCTFAMDSSTNSLVASCNGSATKIVVNPAALGCVEDADGVLTCNGFVSADQNLNNPVASNRFRIFNNGVNLTPDPTCTDYGASNMTSFLDIDESASTDIYAVCNGTTEAGALPSAQPPALYIPGIDDGTLNTAALSANLMSCIRWRPPGSKTVTNYTVQVQTVCGASQTAAICVFKDTDAKTCSAGTNNNATCTTASQCPGGACTSLISDMGRIDCTSTGVKQASAVTGFTLHQGQVYRFCWTSADTSVKLVGGANSTLWGAATNPMRVGTAATASTGTTSTLACPALTGALTQITTGPPSIVLQ